ncbi:hypothetical protein [Amycolatopsis alkalitolerans]|uniref:Uncharacterized protein n=1 Tax=Amycolatopsis alkalitolerans TaxID=2547244 RepID=A0A5C4M5D6_9PSEU|nr:hypothetical protein [Amycolatopsis alkalitolerans]TNC25706.1 hypothetical protein FG385_13715 [Amycolatopsis alkalitolerans]
MTVATLAKPDYDVLNVVALKKMASVPVIARVCGRDTADADAALARLAETGLVYLADGAALPSDEAEPALAEAASRFYAGVRQDPLIASLVDRFDKVNAQFLKAMSAWQLIEVGGRKITNNHRDSAYDDKVIFRLGRLIQQLQPLLTALAEHDRRFLTYQHRFLASSRAVDGGQHDLVSSPTADSIHNIWFEFHEDLLRTLGRERTE